MQPQQEPFDTLGRWMLTRLRADLAPPQNFPSSPLIPFFISLYEDMLANPGEYFIPVEAFVPFIARVLLTPEESAQHEALKAARMRVRRVVFGYLEFLFDLGQVGEAMGMDLCLPQAEFDRLAAAAVKKTRTRHFLAAMERCGLTFSQGDPVIASNRDNPGMPAALGPFSQACARVKDFDFYLFRRCDLAVFDGKTNPDFADALRLAPQPFQAEVAETDARLMAMRFKREIFVDGGDMTYRVRYSKKGDQVVYWLRIQETFQPDLGHYLRWKLDTDLTPRLFQRLEETAPGLAGQVFAGLKQCAQCYGENCLARGQVVWGGTVKDVCKEYGWNQIGHSRAEYERLWTVLETFDQLLSRAG